MLQRAQYFKIMTKTETKKQAQQELRTADHINNLQPPVTLGITGPRYSKILQCQITVLNHSLEHVLIEKSFSLGHCPKGFSLRSFI